MVTIANCKVPAHYENYVKANKEQDLIDALEASDKRFRKLAKKIGNKKADHAYAEGKWTLKELLQHIIDAERVFAYRALTFSRKDTTSLPGFDENQWAANSKASARDWDDLVEEYKCLRNSTISMFQGFDEEQLLQTGTANGHEVNVIGFGFVTAGHLQHHCNIIKERYM